MWGWERSGVINNVNVMSQPLLPGSREGSVIVFLSSTSTSTPLWFPLLFLSWESTEDVLRWCLLLNYTSLGHQG